MKGRTQKTSDEDHELVSLSKKGDIDAFEILVRKYQKKMFNIAYRMIGSYDEACEIVQDTFVSAYRNLKRFKGKARFSTWLYTIVVNLSKNRLRKLRAQLYHEQLSIHNPVQTNNGEMQGEFASNEVSVLERLERRDIQEEVQKCISALDPEFREVLILKDIQGFSYDEISGMLAIPEGTVKSRLFRARDAIKDCLKKVRGDL
jgi:RNA polymerase sigma-70 factor (ECF subfamily)